MLLIEQLTRFAYSRLFDSGLRFCPQHLFFVESTLRVVLGMPVILPSHPPPPTAPQYTNSYFLSLGLQKCRAWWRSSRKAYRRISSSKSGQRSITLLYVDFERNPCLLLEGSTKNAWSESPNFPFPGVRRPPSHTEWQRKTPSSERLQHDT